MAQAIDQQRNILNLFASVCILVLSYFDWPGLAARFGVHPFFVGLLLTLLTLAALVFLVVSILDWRTLRQTHG